MSGLGKLTLRMVSRLRHLATLAGSHLMSGFDPQLLSMKSKESSGDAAITSHTIDSGKGG